MDKVSQSHFSPETRPTIQPAAINKPRDFSNVEKLYRLYGKYAFSLAKQSSANDQIAEEIVHEVFLKYWSGKDLSIQNLSSVSFFGWLLTEVQKNCKECIL